MRLVELLTPARVVVPLTAETLRDAAVELADALVASGAATNPDKIRALVLQAIPEAVVTVGDAFLVHLRTDAVARLAACLGIASTPLLRGGESEKAARIVVVIVGPPKEASSYLQTLSALARLMGREDVVRTLLEARTPGEVLAAAPLADLELPGYLTVRDIMVPRSVVAVRPDTTLGDVSRLMVANDLPALPVLSESNELVGVVSHREVLRYLLPMYLKRMSRGPVEGLPRGGDVSDPHQLPVKEVMQRSVLSVSENQTVADVATMMVNKDIDRFPVVREGVLVGFLTRADVVRRVFGP